MQHSICRGALANMLVTSCKDNICRIWSETILPDDGLVNLEQLDPSFVHDPKFHTHRHKKRFMHRLRHIRSVEETEGLLERWSKPLENNSATPRTIKSPMSLFKNLHFPNDMQSL